MIVARKKFEIVGTAELSSTKRSVRMKITPVYSILDEYYYVGIKDLEAVLNGRKKWATIYVGREENMKVDLQDERGS